MSEAQDTRGLVRSRKYCYEVVTGMGEDTAHHYMEHFLLSDHGAAEVCSVLTMTIGICFLAVLEERVLRPKGCRDGPWCSSLGLSCYPVLNEFLLSTSSMHSEKL